MSPLKFGNKKNLSIFCFLIQCMIWLFAVCSMSFIFCKKITPLYTEDSLNSVQPIKTSELKPGESISQSFRSSYDHLYSVGVAISYQNDIPEDTAVLFQVLSEEKLIIEQPLSIWYVPDSGFFTLEADLQNCQNETITIRVENVSPQGSDDAVFSLLATDKEYLYSDNSENYLFNDEPQEGRLLFTVSYLTGYSYYHALTYAFWIFLTALIGSSLLSKLFSKLSIYYST